MKNLEPMLKKIFLETEPLKSPLLLMLISIVFLILSFPKFNLYFFAWVALVPFLLALRSKKLFDLFLFAFIAGMVFAFSLFFEFYHKAIPLSTLVVIVYGLNFGIFACLAAFFYKKTKSNEVLKRILFVPCAYVFIFEYLRSFELFGADVNILAYSQYKLLPIIQICDIMGAYGLSWLIVFFNAYLTEIIICKGVSGHTSAKIKLFQIIIPPLIILLCFVYGFYKLNKDYAANKKITITIIQPNIGIETNDGQQRNINNKMLKLYSLADIAASVKTDLIIFPETVFPGYLLLDIKLQKHIINFVDNHKINILIGGYHYNYDIKKPYNGVFLMANNKGIQDFYFKNHLFPFGEYNPVEFLEFSKYIILEDRQYFAAGTRQTIFDINGNKFAAFICFESLFPSYVRSSVIKGAQFLTVVTDDQWFEGSGVVCQHLIASLFRAVENERSLIQAANKGYSAIIDPCGRITKISRLFTNEMLRSDIYMLSKKSIFTKYGEWFIWLCGAVVITGLIVFKRKGIK